jgi:hypothetical protein
MEKPGLIASTPTFLETEAWYHLPFDVLVCKARATNNVDISRDPGFSQPGSEGLYSFFR